MTSFQIVLLILSFILILLFLFGGTMFLVFLERLVHARVQHRDGPGRGGQVDYFQVWKDFLKTGIKHGSTDAVFAWRFKLIFNVWKVLPAIFLLVLLTGLLPSNLADTGLPFLLFLPLVAASVEAIFIHATANARERFEWRKMLLLTIMGAATLFLSVFAVALRVGSSSLTAISDFQMEFPYFALLSSPGLFLCGLSAFCSIFLFANEAPIQNDEEIGLSRSLQYFVFFIRKMWVFCLLCFWIFVFGGGASGIIPKILFPFKVALALFLFTLLQASFPMIRSTDASELAARWLLRLSIIGFFLEAIWVGVWG